MTVTKSPVYATYPLIYEKSFNSKPYEVNSAFPSCCALPLPLDRTASDALLLWWIGGRLAQYLRPRALAVMCETDSGVPLPLVSILLWSCFDPLRCLVVPFYDFVYFVLVAQAFISTGGHSDTSCSDGDLAALPTCGWSKDNAGKNIV